VLEVDKDERHPNPGRRLLRVERCRVRQRLDGDAVDVVRNCASRRAVELVRLAQWHRHVAAVGRDRRDGLDLARLPPAPFGREPPGDRRLVRVGRGPGKGGCVGVVPRDTGEGADAWVVGDRPGHVPSSGADTDGHNWKVAGALVSTQRRHRGTHVVRFALGVLELARLSLALSERPVVEGKRGKAPLGQRPRVGARCLILYRRERTCCHHSRQRLFRWQVQHPGEPVASTREDEGFASHPLHALHNTGPRRRIPVDSTPGVARPVVLMAAAPFRGRTRHSRGLPMSDPATGPTRVRLPPASSSAWVALLGSGGSADGKRTRSGPDRAPAPPHRNPCSSGWQSADMRLGLVHVNMASMGRPDDLVAATRAAEAAGFDSVWAGEHIVLPDPQVPPSPMGPKDRALDSLLALTWAAAHTTTIRLATGILILPQRNPLVLAKQVATLDVLSGGRVMLGVGAGYLDPEFRALGANFAARGAMTD
jgi:hypothetical protein